MKKQVNKRIPEFQDQNFHRCGQQNPFSTSFFAEDSLFYFRENCEAGHNQVSESFSFPPKALNLCQEHQLIENQPPASPPLFHSHDDYLLPDFQQACVKVEDIEYLSSNSHQRSSQGFHLREAALFKDRRNLQKLEHSPVNVKQSFSFPQANAQQQFQPQNQMTDKHADDDGFSNLPKSGQKITKNITKNIGKLLLKFIWKYRRMLFQKLGIEKSRWDTFINAVSKWKKENNITRQFLISRWHDGADSALFRTLSRHFFRKRCYAAILKSNIRMKGIHFSRVGRFSAAITDPSALDFIT